jgi:hypothetical protein
MPNDKDDNRVEDSRPVLVIRSSLEKYLFFPIFMALLSLLPIYILIHDIVKGQNLRQDLPGLIVVLFGFVLIGSIGPICAIRFGVRVDHKYLWARNFLKFQRIRLCDIERIDQKHTGVTEDTIFSWFLDMYGWYVHPKPESGARGFFIKYTFMPEQDAARFVILMRQYFPHEHKEFMPIFVRKTLIKAIEKEQSKK